MNNKIRGDLAGCGLGAFVNGMRNLPVFQTMIGKKLAVVLWYVHWQEPFPVSEADVVYNNGSIPLITWEPWVSHPSGTLTAIAAGEYDNYVREFMRAARDWGKPLFLRLGHEMNGNWYPWDGFHNGGESGPEKYRQAWLYIYNVREELKAENVNLVWCPNNINVPNAAWNNIAAYYPGDQSVDWVGMDGYNWGFADWQSFRSVFNEGYRSLAALTDKPIMIGEFASSEQGGDKAAWIKEAIFNIKNDFPRIKLVCWFNINKERDWRLDSSIDPNKVFQAAIGDRYFIENLL
jgi:beta-mannanase